MNWNHRWLSGEWRSFAALLSVTPAVGLVWLGPRFEAETTLTAWVGVLGYSRAQRFLGIPVYQNFLDLGSRLPLAAQVSSSPISLFGAITTPDFVQAVTLSVFLALTALAAVRFAISNRLLSMFLIGQGALFFFAVAHYFIANDWSEFVIGFLGLYLGLFFIVDARASSFQWHPHHTFSLFLSGLMLSLTHAGYLGVAVYSFAGVLAVNLFSRDFRRFLSKGFLFVILSGFLFIATWLDTGIYLLTNEVLGNPAETEVRDVMRDFLTMGIGSTIQSPIDVVVERVLFFPWPIYVAAFLMLAKNRKARTPRAIEASSLRILTAAALVGLIAVVSPTINLPFEPSQNYLYRDGCLLLGFAALLSSVPSSRERVPVRSGPLHAMAPVCLGLVFLIAIGLSGVAHKGMVTSAVGDGPCSSRVEPETFWPEQEIWRASQPLSYGAYADCSLVDIVQQGNYSLGAWLKMRQSLLDGKSQFELENKGEFTPGALPLFTSLGDYTHVQGNFDKILRQNIDLVLEDYHSEGLVALERCFTGCVIRVEVPGPGSYMIPWNFDPALTADENHKILPNDFGLIDLQATQAGIVEIHYFTPWSQIVSVGASWINFFSPWIALLAGELSRKRRPASAREAGS